MRVSNSLGGGPLLLAGSESQKKEYLPQVASGEKILVFGLTEPGAGSDAGGTTTTAIPDGEDFIINGRKCFISGAPMADWIIIYAKTDLSQKGSRGISMFIVDMHAEGVSLGAPEKKMGINLPGTEPVRQEERRRRPGGELHHREGVRSRSEERRVGKECRSRWSPYH